MIENISTSFKAIWAHKMRSFLTMLGVIIGIASIIAIVSTIKGTNDQILENLIGAGNNNIKISLRQGEGEYWMDGGAPDGVNCVTEKQKEDIRNIKNAVSASFYVSRSWVDGVYAGDKSMDSGSILGIDDQYLKTAGYIVYEGRPFAESDFKNFNKVLLLDEAAAAALFEDTDPLGKIVDIKNEPYVVVGLIKRSDQFKPVIESVQDYYNYNQEQYGTLYMPVTSWPISYAFDEPETCIVRAEKAEDISRIGREAAKIMNESVVTSDKTISYAAEDLLEKARNKQELASSTNRLLIWVASIALIVGGIGVMNIMLVSVTERTSEIGLKKALGAKKRRILVQFLTESAILTLIGGILGVISGIVMANVISRLTLTPVAISVPAILFAVVFSMVIGIIFGILPSIKAANLNPIDALRRE